MGYNKMAMKCNLCPRNCNTVRSRSLGVCRTDGMLVSRVARHDWEEPCISGNRGSGTVFFAGCNLHCCFCQNYDISVVPHGVKLSPARLADVLVYMQDMGVANINLVTPTHVSDKLATALSMAKPHLNIPVIYNTSSYEKPEALHRLQGLVDVYLPDMKFCDVEVSRSLANARDYFEVATAAIREMRRQQPTNVYDEQGYIQKGVIVRHLVLPSFVEDTKHILDWLADLDRDIVVSLMSQYFVARRNENIPALNRKLYRHEYKAACEYFYNVGLHNGYFQEIDSATKDYLPDFDDGQVEVLLQKIPYIFPETDIE